MWLADVRNDKTSFSPSQNVSSVDRHTNEIIQQLNKKHISLT